MGVDTAQLEIIHDYIDQRAMHRVTWIVIWLIVVAIFVAVVSFDQLHQLQGHVADNFRARSPLD